MSLEYTMYIREHVSNVYKAYQWMREHLPQLFENDRYDEPINWETFIRSHDASKYNIDEYDAYDKYFYGKNRSHKVVEDFNRAWLLHIHRNPHHWQHFILIKDNPGEETVIMKMPLQYVIEMICDWWSFSWKTGDLYEVFNWWNEHKDYIKLHDVTRMTVTNILSDIKKELDKIFVKEDNKNPLFDFIVPKEN